MKANTEKFLRTYRAIGNLENVEVIGRNERLQKEKRMLQLEKELSKYASKITEDQFCFLGDLCLNDFEEFKDAYEL